jgi:hypothetical protein
LCCSDYRLPRAYTQQNAGAGRTILRSKPKVVRSKPELVRSKRKMMRGTATFWRVNRKWD